MAVFSMFARVYVAVSYVKMFCDSPSVQSCIQIILFYISAVHNEPKSVPVAAQQTKMAAIDSLNFGSVD